MTHSRFALVLAATAMLLPAGPAGAKTSADRKLDRALDKLVAMKHGPVGVASVIQRGGKPILHTAGVADLKAGSAIRASDRMRLASTAKAFSGAVALSLVNQGKLSLDDTIGQRLPDFPAAWAPVTLRQLLHHTSGVPDYTKSKGFAQSLTNNPRKHLEPLDLIGFVKDKPLEFAPGSKYEYSNTDNITVGLIAEAVTGKPYEQDLKSLVYDRLNLNRTSLPSGFTIRRPFIHGYDVSGRRPQDISTAVSASGAWASGGVVSTPADLNRFIRGYVGGRLFGSAIQSQQFSFVKGSSDPPGPGTNAAGLAVFRYRTSCGTVFGHTGSFPGYTQFAAATRNGRRSVTVSASSQLTPTNGDPNVFAALRRADALAVCAATG